MIRSILSLYWWKYPEALVYMLQNTEYQAVPYLKWYWHVKDFTKVAYRRELDQTKAAKMLIIALRLGMFAQIALGIILIALWWKDPIYKELQLGFAVLITYPITWAHLVVLPLFLGRIFIVLPKQKKIIAASEDIFKNHKGIKIAIAGSYGKTSMKELLVTVLENSKKVAATPANKNVAISHAYFANNLTGDEDVVIIEYGEGAPGDIAKFASITHPTHAIITGIAPAHLDKYKFIERAAEDIFSIQDFVDEKHIYVNNESKLAKLYSEKTKFNKYNHNEALGWKIKNIDISLDGTRFTMTKSNRVLKLKSKLLGRHQVAPLAMVAALSAELGLSDEEIIIGIAKTKPFEHRMQPYALGGATIIDDTYNGNIEGIKAGIALLKELPSKKKTYVTPGLVDQGVETVNVHQEIGRLLADANPNHIILMNNSAAPIIADSLKKSGYTRKLTIEKNPLDFYKNLNMFFASGDLVLMQNDWTDNYL